MDSVSKPGLQRRLRRFHHVERIINRRAKLAYQLGFTPMPIRWQPFKKCWYVDDHRLYRALGVTCPCEWEELGYNWWKENKEKNEPTNELADHKSITDSWYDRKVYGNSKKVLTRQELRAFDSYQQQLAERDQKE